MNTLQEQMVSYILPPEAIDLPYLYKCLKQPTDEIKPLWSSADNEAKYYHIQIHAEEMYDNDCCSENADTYVCEICNSDVPQVFFREHNESETHLTLRRICENVLQRVSKQLSVNVQDKSASCDTFCCHLCNKVVKIQNRSQHEHSLQHAKALQRLKLLNNFYNTFLNIDDDEDSCTNDVANRNNLDDKINLRDSNNSYFSSNDRGVEYDSDDSFVSPSTSLIVNSPLKTNETDILNISNKSTTTNKQLEKISFEMYFKEVINKFGLCILPPQTEGEYIYVMTPSGSKLKVSREHFHSFVEVNNKTYCQICKCVPQDAGAHEFTETHVTNIFKTINEYFAREIDHVYSHCLVCNEVIVTQSDHHRINDNHKSLITQNNLPTPPTTTETGAQSDDHRINDNHRSVITQNNLPTPTNTEIKTPKRKRLRHRYISKQKLDYNNINKIDNDQFHCEVCNVNINFQDLHKHINDEAHVTKNEDYNKTDNNSEICRTCQVKVPKGGLKEHINSSPHIEKMLPETVKTNNNKNYDIEIKYNSQIADKDNITRNNSVPGTSKGDIAENGNKNGEHVRKHLAQSTNSSAAIKANYSRLFKTINNLNLILCKACNKKVPNSDRNITEHVNGRAHNITVNELYKYFYSDDTKTILECRICDVDIPNKNVDVIEHVFSENHKEEYKNLLVFHKISEQNAVFYRCEPCEEQSIYDPFSHINCNRHTDNLVEIFGFISKLSLIQYMYCGNTRGAVAVLHRELYKNILSSNQINQLENGVHFCKICNLEITRMFEISHVSDEKHLSNKKHISLLKDLCNELRQFVVSQ